MRAMMKLIVLCMYFIVPIIATVDFCGPCAAFDCYGNGACLLTDSQTLTTECNVNPHLFKNITDCVGHPDYVGPFWCGECSPETSTEPAETSPAPGSTITWNFVATFDSKLGSYNFESTGEGPDFCQEITFPASCNMLHAELKRDAQKKAGMRMIPNLSLGSCQLTSDCSKRVSDQLKIWNVSMIMPHQLCSNAIQYNHYCAPTETVDVVVEVQGVNETNKDTVCDGFAEAVNGTTEYCSLSGPNTKRRRLTTNLYMDITVRDATKAVATMEKENFVETVTLPSEVKVTTVTAKKATPVVKVCPPNTIKKSGDCYCKHDRTLLASDNNCPTSVLTTSATTQQSVDVCFMAVLFLLGLLI